MSPRALAPVLLGVLACAARPAAADRSFDVVGLRPAVDSYGLVVVERAETPQRWEPGAQLVVGYTHAPLHLRMATADGKSSFDTDLVRGHVGLDLGLSLGLWDFLAIAASLPLGAQFYDGDAAGSPVVVPRGGSATPSTVGTGVYRGAPRENIPLADAGPRDPRLTIKARLYRNNVFGVALLASATVPLGNSNSFLGEHGPAFRPMVVADVRLWSRLSLAVNLGAVIRRFSQLRDPVTQALLLSQSEDLTFALGVAYRAHRLFGLSLEAWGAAPVGVPEDNKITLPGESSPPVDRSVNVDLLGTALIYPAPSLRLGISGGGGLISGSPLRDGGRVLVSVAFSPAPRSSYGGLP